MQVISFKNTGLFKRGIWLSAAALTASVVSPFLLDGSLWRNPASSLAGVCVVGAFFGYFLWKIPIHRFADEVLDCQDHLIVRRGRSEAIISLSNIALAEVSGGGGVHRITLRLREPTKFGREIEFLPQASLWSNLAGIKRVAAGLTERASGRTAVGDPI